MEMHLVMVTPHMAGEWLATQHDNRRLKDFKVAEWAHEMAEGRWKPIPQPIMFDQFKRLIDGQHRLTAVVRSGATVQMWIAYNVPGDLRRYVDSGTPRSAADVLQMEHGVTSRVAVAATAKSVLLYESAPDAIWNSKAVVGKQEIIDEVVMHADQYATSVAMGLAATRTTASGIYLTRNSYAALWVLVQRHGSVDLWNEWHEGVSTGAMLTPGDPRLSLRNARGTRWGGGQSSVLACIKTWNAYVKNEPLQKIYASSSRYLPMPEIL